MKCNMVIWVVLKQFWVWRRGSFMLLCTPFTAIHFCCHCSIPFCCVQPLFVLIVCVICLFLFLNLILYQVLFFICKRLLRNLSPLFEEHNEEHTVYILHQFTSVYSFICPFKALCLLFRLRFCTVKPLVLKSCTAPKSHFLLNKFRFLQSRVCIISMKCFAKCNQNKTI